MYACKIFLLIISIMSKDIQNITCTNTPEMSSGVFHRNTKAIHNTLNKIFTSLKLNKTFKESTKIRLLITMHKNLVNILRNNYKKSEVGNNSDNTPIKAFQKNNIDEILEEEYVLLFFSPNKTVQHKYPISSLRLTQSISDQFSDYLKQFLLKINNITSCRPETSHAPHTPEDNNTILFNETSARRSGRKTLPHNLKPWVPDAAQSFAFNRRIFKSKNTKIKKYPFMASIHISGEFVCAGSIISLDLIITAASCLQVAYLRRHTKDFQTNVSVRIGSDYSNYDGEYIPIAFIYFHPNYNPQNLKHNLALMKMTKQKQISKKYKIRRVLFDKTSYDLPSDVKRVTIVGWGATDPMNQKDSDILTLAHLDLYDIEECKAVYSDLYVTESNFCAGFISRGSGACNKDVGNPAVVAGVLVGVVSFGPPQCGTPDAPTVFTRIGLYSEWVDSILKMDPSANTESRPYLRMSARTSRKPQYVSKMKPKREGVNGLGVIKLDLPEEFFILKEILTDIARSNNSGINEVIDEGFDKEFLEYMKPTPKMILKNHPLVNRSLFDISGANFPQQISKPKETPIKYGLNIPQNKFPDYGGNYQQIGEMIDVLFEQQESNIPLVSKYPSFMSITTKHPNSLIQREGSTLNDPVMTTPLYDDDSDSSDRSSGNYEGTGSDEGMSIELKKTSTKPIDKNTQVLFDFDDNEFNEYSDIKRTTLTPTTASKDFHKIIFVLENEVKVKKYNKPHTNPKKISGNQNKNTFSKTTIEFNDVDYTPESGDSTESDDYIAIANKNFRYDSVANKFTKA